MQVLQQTPETHSLCSLPIVFFFFFLTTQNISNVPRVKIGGNKAENTQVSISDSRHLPALAPSNLLSRLPSLPLLLPSFLSSPSLHLSVFFFRLFCFVFFTLWSLCHPDTKHSPSSHPFLSSRYPPSVRLHLSVSIDQTGFLQDLHTVACNDLAWCLRWSVRVCVSGREKRKTGERLTDSDKLDLLKYWSPVLTSVDLSHSL